jgi:hypothetical protein
MLWGLGEELRRRLFLPYFKLCGCKSRVSDRFNNGIDGICSLTWCQSGGARGSHAISVRLHVIGQAAFTGFMLEGRSGVVPCSQAACFHLSSIGYHHHSTHNKRYLDTAECNSAAKM